MMPGTAVAILPKYDDLLASCRKIYRRAAEELLSSYWDLGDAINRALGESRKQYGEGTVGRLAEDLAVDQGTLYRAMALAHRWTRDELKPAVGWKKYIALLPLAKDKADDLARKAEEKNLSYEALRELIHREKLKGLDVEEAAVLHLRQVLSRLSAIPDFSAAKDGLEVKVLEKSLHDKLLERVSEAERRVAEFKKFLQKVKVKEGEEDREAKKGGERMKIQEGEGRSGETNHPPAGHPPPGPGEESGVEVARLGGSPR
jgi:hypothetical protein